MELQKDEDTIRPTLHISNLNGPDLWIGEGYYVEDFSKEEWTVMIMPDLLLYEPMTLFPIKAKQERSFKFAEKGEFKRFNLLFYIMTNFKLITKDVWDKSNIKTTKEKITIYHALPDSGLLFVSINNLPLNGKTDTVSIQVQN